MRKALVVLSVSLFVLSAAASAWAGSGDLKVTATVKTWYNAWEEKDEDFNGETETRDFGSALMLGPAVTVRFSKVVLGASYLVSMQGYEPEASGGSTLTYDRKDLDLTATYMFFPSFGVFVGYKSIDSPVEITETGEDFGSSELKGPGIGITGNLALGESLALYGSLAYLKMDRDYSSTDREFSYDMSGASLDVGLVWAFTSSLSVSAGFKGQLFSGDSDDGLNHESQYMGAVVGLNYTF